MTNHKTYHHFKLTTDEDQILWIAVDRENARVNSLSYAVFEELAVIIDEIKENKPKGVIIYSAKKQGFIAGADITQFSTLKTEDEGYQIIRQAQVILDKLEALPMPTLAMIKGFALGGGYELALACSYRVAENSEKTLIGLPEVKLGIHPGWAGTVRLPKLIGAPKAMNIILRGRVLKAKAALKIGMIDAAVPERELKRAARYYIVHRPKKHKACWIEQMTNQAWLRPILGNIIRKKLAKKVKKAHYPAPFAVIEHWMKEGVGKKAQLAEANSIAKLLVDPCSRNLVRVFFLKERMKSLAKSVKLSLNHVHIIGAGTMGGDIAAWCALSGFDVTLQDQSAERIAPSIKRAYRLFQKKLKEKRLIQAAMDRLQPDVKGQGVRRADIVIEAVFEDLKVKQTLFQELETKIKPEAILASNTSSILLDEINQTMQNKSRLIGIHFFNPVAKMPLVEVIRGQNSDNKWIEKGLAFVGKIAREPLPVKSSPGFLINRILMPYLMEALILLEQGVSMEAIDKAAVDFGMPIGPVTLSDTIGLDVCLAVADNLVSVYGGNIPQELRDKVAKKQLGRKTHHGFYDYHKGKKPAVSDHKKTTLSEAEITDRLILRMVNESVACLREKVIEDADLLDAGMIFGTGFAPFRGGPIHYAKTRGYKAVFERLGQLETQHGQRFKADQGWSSLLEDKPS